MNIRKAHVQDVTEIRSLIVRAVEPESNPDFDEEGVKLFYKPNELAAIKSRILDDNYLTLCFIKDDRIVGIITMHEHEKLDQLFVDPSFRNMGISRELWLAAKEHCFKMGNKSGYWVKSSTVAIPVYKSFGFRLTDVRQQKNGITYYPMVLEL